MLSQPDFNLTPFTAHPMLASLASFSVLTDFLSPRIEHSSSLGLSLNTETTHRAEGMSQEVSRMSHGVDMTYGLTVVPWCPPSCPTALPHQQLQPWLLPLDLHTTGTESLVRNEVAAASSGSK